MGPGVPSGEMLPVKGRVVTNLRLDWVADPIFAGRFTSKLTQNGHFQAFTAMGAKKARLGWKAGKGG